MKISRPIFLGLANILLLMSFLTACSEQSNYGKPIDISIANGQITYHFTTALEASYSATQFKLLCNTPGACPENVGSLIHHNEKDLSVCTFSLIAEDIAISNRHCISDKIAKRGASCEGIVEFVLLNHNSTTASSIYQCDKVMSIPEEYLKANSGRAQRDFAVFKIKRKRPDGIALNNFRQNPFQPDQRGIPSGESFHVIVADPNPRTLGATFREQICTSIIHPALSSSYAEATDPAVTLIHCDIKHGNSGSPVLDDKYKLRGVITQFSEPESLDPKKVAAASEDAFARRAVHLREIENKLDIAYAFNLSCIDAPELKLQISSKKNCTLIPKKITLESISPLNTREFQTKNSERLNFLKNEANLKSLVFDWQWTQPTESDWGIEMKRHRLVQELSPFCFKGIYDKFSWTSSVTIPDPSGDSIYNISLPAALSDEDIDPTLKLFVVNSMRLQNLVIKFKLNELLHSAEHSTMVSVTRSGFILSKSEVSKQKVGFCFSYVKK